MNKMDKLAILWIVLCIIGWAGFYITGTVLQNKDLAMYVAITFASVSAALMFYLVKDGMKSGVIYFGRCGPFYKSSDPLGFWSSVVGAMFLGGTFLVGAIKLLIMVYVGDYAFISRFLNSG